MRRRMKAAVAVGLVGVFALAGCASTSEEVADDGVVAGTLTVETITAYEGAIGAAADAFQEKYPDVEIELTATDSVAINTSLRTRLAAGTAPDVFLAHPGASVPLSVHSLAPAGHLADLSDLEFNDDVAPSMDSITSYEGKRYTLPLALNGIGVIYNENAVEEAGLEFPRTYSEVLQFCADARDAGKVAFAYPAQVPWINVALPYIYAATLVYSENPQFAEDKDNGDASFVDPGWVESVTKVTEMEEAGCFQESPVGTAYEVGVAMVAQGEALAIASVTSTIAALHDVAPADSVFSFRTLPATEDADDTWAIVGPIGGHAINADAANPAAARAFIEFMASSEMQAVIAEESGGLPALPTEDFDVPAELAEAMEYLAAEKAIYNPSHAFPGPKPFDALTEGMQLLLGSQASVEDVLRGMDAAWSN